MSPISRREFIALAIAVGAEAAWCSPFAKDSSVKWTERRDLFPEGVASGDPDSSSVLLWTRHPVVGATKKDATSAKLTLEVAEDNAFKRVIATKTATILAEADWTCRVLVGGLQPRKVYWYRFTNEKGEGSRIGRTMTAPTDKDTRPVSFAFVSCQNANLGYLNAYRRMIFEDERAPEAEQLGFVLHLGDFVYEIVWYPEDKATYYERTVRDVVRYPHGEKIQDYHLPTTLEDYRVLYRSYLSDPDLQDARARWPFVTIWDNHEFSWLGWQSYESFPGVETRPAAAKKVAANQALFEYQPTRMTRPNSTSLEKFDAPKVENKMYSNFDDTGLSQEPNNITAISSLRGWRSLNWGANVEVMITDQRSHRSKDPGDEPGAEALSNKDFSIFFPEEVLWILDGGREYNNGKPPDTFMFGDKEVKNVWKDKSPQTLMGAEQKAWLLDRLKKSKATWKIWGSPTGTMEVRADPQNLPPELYPKGWGKHDYAALGDGGMSNAYHERGQIYDFVRKEGITGFTTVCGDRHAFWAGLAAKSLPPKEFDPVGVVFIAGSISAPGGQEAYDSRTKQDRPLAPLLVGMGPNDTKPQPTLSLMLHHGVRSCLEYKKTGDIAAAKKLSNPELSPHVSFVDSGSHGYAVVRASATNIYSEFVCIPRPAKNPEGKDGGPLLYRVRHEAKLWKRGEKPQLVGKVLEGDPKFHT